jgi:hypothetical protein
MTTSITFTIPAATMKALALFAAEKDIRYYLKGVCVDLRTFGQPVLVATDGHRMIAVHTHQAAGCDIPELETWPISCPAECIIPIDLIKAIKPGTRGHVRVTLSDIVTPEPTKFDDSPKPTFSRVTLSTIGGPEVSGKPLDGKFSDWRRVIPSTSAAVMVPFDVRSINLDFLHDARTALQLLGLVSSKYAGLPSYMGAYISAGPVPTLDDLRERGAEAHRCPLTMPLTNGVQVVVMPLRMG